MMGKKHNDSDLYEILHFTPKISSEVQDKIDTAYEQIRNADVCHDSASAAKKIPGAFEKRRLRKGISLGFAAAFVLTLAFLGFSNPALAGKIPFIGRIFKLVETDIGYQGNYSEHSVPVTPSESDTAVSQSGSTKTYTSKERNAAKAISEDASPDDFSQTSENVTITFSEASYTEMALYFSLEIYSEEGFPEDFNRVKNMDGYILSYDVLNMHSRQSFDFSMTNSAGDENSIALSSEEEGFPAPYSIEGIYIDTHTFLGVIRVDMEEVRRILDVDSLPPEFIYTLTIDRFWGRLNETEDVTASNSETGETMVIPQPIKKYYEGPWSFTIPVSLNETETLTKELMDTNETGFGIATVVKTPYEIKADPILPDNVDSFDYIVVITDADGNILDSQGQTADIYSVYGRNTDTVYIYVLDYMTYMDECKYENASLLPEKALYQTTVTW